LILRRDGDEAVIDVSDNGQGMAPDYIQNQLFRPLDTGKTDGMGLGAYQARQMVRDMGGRLEVSSRVGEGTTMIVRLPVATEPMPRHPLAAADTGQSA
jgi:signal transduction histidine kinase